MPLPLRVCVFLACACLVAAMPLPWTDALQPGASGKLVLIAQSLLNRDAAVNPKLAVDGTFGPAMANALAAYQAAHQLTASRVFDAPTAESVLAEHSRDGVVDSGFTAGSLGYLYKLHLPVHANRSRETVATLFDADNKVLLQFTARAHGYRDDGQERTWPDFGNGDVGLNQFTNSGATVTGLVELDLSTWGGCLCFRLHATST